MIDDEKRETKKDPIARDEAQELLLKKRWPVNKIQNTRLVRNLLSFLKFNI